MKISNFTKLLTLGLFSLSFLSLTYVSGVYTATTGNFFIWQIKGETDTGDKIDKLFKANLSINVDGSILGVSCESYDRTGDEFEVSNGALVDAQIIEFIFSTEIIEGFKSANNTEEKEVHYAGNDYNAYVWDSEEEKLIIAKSSGILLESRVEGKNIKLVSTVNQNLLTYYPPGGISGYIFMMVVGVCIISILLISKKKGI